MRYRRLFESARDGILILDAGTGKITDVNPFMIELLAYTREEFLGKELWEIGVYHDKNESVAAFNKLQETRYIRYDDLPLKTKKGLTRDVEFVSNVYLEGDREVIQCNIRDITERKITEAAMVKSEARFRQLVESSIIGIIISDFNGAILEANDVFLNMVGYSRSDLLAGKLRWDEMTPPELLWQDKRAIMELSNSRDSRPREKEYIRKDGSRVPVLVGGTLVKGSASTVMAFVLDISDQKEAAKELNRVYAENELRVRTFDTLLSSISDMTYTFDRNERFHYANRPVLELYGKTFEEIRGKTFADLGYPSELTDHIRQNLQQVFNTGRSVRNETQFPDAKGKTGFYEYIFNPVFGTDNIVEFVVGSARDITERKKSEEALRKAEAKYRQIVESLPAIVYRTEPNPPYAPTYVSPNIEMFGLSPEEWYAEPDMWASLIHSEDRQRVLSTIEGVRAQGVDSELEYRIVAKDGSVHWWQDKGRFVSDEQGNRTGWQGIILDMTATKELEHQLRQGQRLESVGILAGGIAHDFNNMLTAINGYAQMTLRNLKEGDPLRGNIEEIMKAGLRSAALTDQLLAFSRRQVLRPVVLNLNTVIADTLKMLQRLIGEDIQLTATLEPRIGRVIVDPGQFSQIVMNLAVNARDAMPQGGTLTIATANVFIEPEYARQHVGILPGAYVLTTVSDNGSGMSEDIKQHIFEPFFTTKEVGRGTGLGLATAYGIVKQSGGSIEVSSEEGTGTTFRVFLPRVTAAIDVSNKKQVPLAMSGGTETILLVEDEDLVRNLSRHILEECGYKVIEAINGIEALQICARQGPIDLLLTDVVMPQMGGRELSEKLRETIPDVRILFTSGYTDDEVVKHGVIEIDTNFIQKPFTPESLAQKVRKVLDNGKKKTG